MNFYYDPAQVQTALRAQVEHYFSTENLVRDVYLRRRMDVEGYIPCEMLFGFPRVRQMCYSIEFMLEAVKDSQVLDVDLENEKVRVRGDWKKWLFPSSDGTLGVPLYSKFPRQQPQQQQQQPAAAVQPLTPSPTPPFAQAKDGVDSGSDSSASTSAPSSDSEESDASPSIPSTPTRQSNSPSPAPTPSSKAGLSAAAAEWTPTFA
jgi:la-related protein 1